MLKVRRSEDPPQIRPGAGRKGENGEAAQVLGSDQPISLAKIGASVLKKESLSRAKKIAWYPHCPEKLRNEEIKTEKTVRDASQ
jgi:hypothetical protein